MSSGDDMLLLTYKTPPNVLRMPSTPFLFCGHYLENSRLLSSAVRTRSQSGGIRAELTVLSTLFFSVERAKSPLVGLRSHECQNALHRQQNQPDIKG